MEINLKAMMADVFECSATEIDNAAEINAVSGWDSLNHIKLMMSLMQSGVAVPASRIPDLTSYPAIVEHLGELGVAIVE